MKINHDDYYYVYNPWDQILTQFKILFKTRKTGVLISLCPFHLEKTPSCLFWPQSGNFRCFGCGEMGDKLYFILRMLGESRIRYRNDFEYVSENRDILERIFQDHSWINRSFQKHPIIDGYHPEFSFMSEL